MEKNSKHTKGNLFIYVIGGGFLKEDFIVKNTKKIIFLVLILFFFIGNRFTCIQKAKEIYRLERKLQELRYEELSISTELTKHSRQSQVEMLIEEQGIELEVAKEPPFILSK